MQNKVVGVLLCAVTVISVFAVAMPENAGTGWYDGTNGSRFIDLNKGSWENQDLNEPDIDSGFSTNNEVPVPESGEGTFHAPLVKNEMGYNVVHPTGSNPDPLDYPESEQPEILITWREDSKEVEVFGVVFLPGDFLWQPLLPVISTNLGEHKTQKTYRAEFPPYFTELSLIERKVPGNIQVRITEFSYNGEPSIILGENHYTTEFKTDESGELSHVHQNIHLEKGYKMNTQYSSKNDMTKVEYNEEGEKKESDIFYGSLPTGVSTYQTFSYVTFLCPILVYWWHPDWSERPWPDYWGDKDSDGINNCLEWYYYGTNASNADTDGDQWRDGHEVYNTKTDPKVKNERYAVLISGGISMCSNYARYWNDLQFMYAILNIYNYTDDNIPGFNPQVDHIVVIYADGNPPTPGQNIPNASCTEGYHNGTGDGEKDQVVDLSGMQRDSIDYPLGKDKNPTKGNWPATMPIDFSATKANVQAVFNTLQNTLTLNDFLFVFVSNHGSGYYNKGGSVFYDGGRIETNSDENDNMKESDLIFDGTSLQKGKYYRWDIDGDSIHDDLLYNNAGTIQLLLDADDDGDGTQDAGEDWSADYKDNNNDNIIDSNDDDKGKGKGAQKMYNIITSSGNADDAIGVDEVLWLWGTRVDAQGNTHFEKLYDDELNSLLNQVGAARITVVLEPCFSGGFIPDLNAGNRVILTAASETEYSWRADGIDPNGNPVQGNPNMVIGEDSYDEFVLHFTAALYLDYPRNTGYVNGYPTAPNVGQAADTDNDGQISMQEAFNYASGQDSRNETPKSSGGNMGITFL